MSIELAVALMVAGLFVVGAAWIAVTRRSGDSPESAEPVVAWLRPKGYRLTHAFPVTELSDELADVEVRAFCGDRWPVAELEPLAEPIELDDDEVPLCALCERAVKRMEHRHE